MGPLTRHYFGLAAVEPAAAAVTQAEGLLDALVARPFWAADGLDALERGLGAAPKADGLGPDEVRVVAAAAARHLAVLADLESVWLAPFARVPYCHLPAGARLARLGHEHRRAPVRRGRRKAMTDGLLRALNQPTGNIGSKSRLESLRLGEAAFVLPDILLTLANSPHRYLPELLATVAPTLSDELFALPTWISDCVDSVVADTPGLEPTPPALEVDVAEVVETALREFEEAGLAPDAARRFAAFSALLRDAMRLYRAEVERCCRNALDAPAAAMLDLFVRKTPSARHAHGRTGVGGKKLDDYFEHSPESGPELLNALAASNWIRPGDPGRSTFLTKLTARTGPMGKIFSAEDIAVIRRWIAALPGEGDSALLPPVALTVPSPAPARPEAPVPAAFDGPRVRELFHDLVIGADRGSTLRQAAAFVEFWLDEAQRMEGPAFTWELPERYVAEDFPDWMRRTYQAMASAPVQPVSDEGKGHRDRSYHGAADNLVDGAWLQGLTRRASLRETEQLLYDIYWDEIGNGSPGHSHGVLYEDLLVRLGYTLPKFWTREFIDEVDFLDEGFLAPVLRLAIAEFPESRLPEIVGVNMVCEFHGLGSAGMSKADDLSGLGFDTGFTRLHIADDNVEMGHSAKSRDAVVFLMAEAARLGATDAVWQRVRRGATAMRMAYVALMQGRLNLAPTQVPAELLEVNGR